MALLTISNVKAEHGISGTDQDTLIQSLVSSVLSLWDDLTDRTWEQATFVEYHEGGYNKIFLKNRPISQIFSIYDDPDWDYGSSDLVDSSNYTFDPDTGIVECAYAFSKGFRSVKAEYSGGYTTAPNWLQEILIRQTIAWLNQAIHKRWDHASITSRDGSTIAFVLKDNLMPEFMIEANAHK